MPQNNVHFRPDVNSAWIEVGSSTTIRIPFIDWRIERSSRIRPLNMMRMGSKEKMRALGMEHFTGKTARIDLRTREARRTERGFMRDQAERVLGGVKH